MKAHDHEYGDSGYCVHCGVAGEFAEPVRLQGRVLRLSESMWSVLRYMAKSPGGIWYPQATTNRGVHEDYADWGQGRSPNALHALVRRGLVENGNHINPRKYGQFRITDEGWALLKSENSD